MFRVIPTFRPAQVVHLCLLCLLCLLASACQRQAVTFSDTRIHPPVAGKSITAAYFTVHNSTTKPVTLIKVVSDVAERVEMHAHEHNNGRMRMVRQPTVTVPAGESVVFEPGGLHLMVFDVAELPETVTFTFVFAERPPMEVSFQRRAR